MSETDKGKWYRPDHLAVRLMRIKESPRPYEHTPFKTILHFGGPIAVAAIIAVVVHEGVSRNHHEKGDTFTLPDETPHEVFSSINEGKALPAEAIGKLVFRAGGVSYVATNRQRERTNIASAEASCGIPSLDSENSEDENDLFVLLTDRHGKQTATVIENSEACRDKKLSLIDTVVLIGHED